MTDEMQGLDWETAPEEFRANRDQLLSEVKSEREKRRALEESLKGYQRRDAFETAVREAEVDGLDPSEFSEFEPDQITVALVKAKAAEAAERQERMFAEVAKTAGYEDAAQFRKALEAVSQQNQQTATAQSAAGAVAMSGSAVGEPEKLKLRELEARQNRGEITQDQVLQWIEEGRVTDDFGVPLRTARR